MAIDQKRALLERDQGPSGGFPRYRYRARRSRLSQDPRPFRDVIQLDNDACRRRLSQDCKERINDSNLRKKLRVVVAPQARDRSTCDVVHVASKQVR